MTDQHQGSGASTSAGVRAARTGPLDRTQIVDATEASLKEDGYDGTTIRRIAKRLNCAVGSIYRHFKDKRELLDAVTQRRFRPVLEAIEAGGMEGTLDATVRRYVTIAVAEPEQYRLMFWLAMLNDEASGVPRVVAEIIDAWAAALSQESGSDEAGLDAARRLWSLNHGQIMLGRAVHATDPTKVVVLVDAAGQPKSPTRRAVTGDEDDVTLL